MVKRFDEGRLIRLAQGDITRVKVDAIANAANSGLRGGAGVDGAIHRVGGKSIMAELDRIREESGGCPTGQAVATGAGELPARYVFHAVGPVYRDGKHGEPELLASAYRSCLELARERDVTSMSFPSISTGVYGYPLEEAAPIALGTVSDALVAGQTLLETVTFVLFDRRTFEAYAEVLSSG